MKSVKRRVMVAPGGLFTSPKYETREFREKTSEPFPESWVDGDLDYGDDLPMGTFHLGLARGSNTNLVCLENPQLGFELKIRLGLSELIKPPPSSLITHAAA